LLCHINWQKILPETAKMVNVSKNHFFTDRNHLECMEQL